jgi:hypothetical protein
MKMYLPTRSTRSLNVTTVTENLFALQNIHCRTDLARLLTPRAMVTRDIFCNLRSMLCFIVLSLISRFKIDLSDLVVRIYEMQMYIYCVNLCMLGNECCRIHFSLDAEVGWWVGGDRKGPCFRIFSKNNPL